MAPFLKPPLSPRLLLLLLLLSPCASLNATNWARIAEEAELAAKAAKIAREEEALTAAERATARAARAEESAAKTASELRASRFRRLNGLESFAESLDRRERYEEAARRFDELGLYCVSRGANDDAANAEKAAQAIREKHPLAQAGMDDGESFDRTITRLSKDDATILRDLEMVDRRVGTFSFVRAEVKAFARDFAIGAQNPMLYLNDETLIDKASRDAWLSAPVEKRVFIIGAGQDAQTIKAHQKSLQSDGYTSFFYQNCLPARGELCDSRLIGALFGTAHRGLLADTMAAGRSPYVPVEIAMAHRLRGHTGLVLLVSPEEIMGAIRAGRTHVMVVAVGLMARPDSNLEDFDQGLSGIRLAGIAGGSLAALLGSGIWVGIRRGDYNRALVALKVSKAIAVELSPTKPLFMLMLTWCGVIIAITGMVTWYYGDPEGASTIVVGFGMTAISFIPMLPGSCYLRLTPEGFSTSFCYYRRKCIAWAEEGEFSLHQGSHEPQVAWEPRRREAQTRLGQVYCKMFPGRRMLPLVFGVPPHRVLELMRFCRQRALGAGDSQTGGDEQTHLFDHQVR